jgi:hypothetical protein
MQIGFMNKEFDLSNFNPDGMSKEEIHEWIAYIGNGQRPAVAKRWFSGVAGQFKLVRDIRNYLWNKVTAMTCREEGKIAEALMYEDICDKIYKQLPHKIRW